MIGTASRRPYELGRVTADLVVLTVLPEEYEAVIGCLAAPDLLLGSEGAPNTYAWQLGALDSPRYRATFRVVVGMGTPTTMYGALAAMQAIRLFDPRYIAFVGVAGGFDRDRQLHGDVAVSSAVVAYEYGKVETGGFAPRGISRTAAMTGWCAQPRRWRAHGGGARTRTPVRRGFARE